MRLISFGLSFSMIALPHFDEKGCREQIPLRSLSRSIILQSASSFTGFSLKLREEKGRWGWQRLKGLRKHNYRYNEMLSCCFSEIGSKKIAPTRRNFPPTKSEANIGLMKLLAILHRALFCALHFFSSLNDRRIQIRQQKTTNDLYYRSVCHVSPQLSPREGATRYDDYQGKLEVGSVVLSMDDTVKVEADDKVKHFLSPIFKLRPT